MGSFLPSVPTLFNRVRINFLISLVTAGNLTFNRFFSVCIQRRWFLWSFAREDALLVRRTWGLPPAFNLDERSYVCALVTGGGILMLKCVEQVSRGAELFVVTC